MFISPQHLQQQDAYHEAVLEARLAALTPYDWGVVSIRLDEEALSAGQVQLHHFFGVLPDGLPLRFERGDPEAPAARPVEGHLESGQRAELYLGVPKDRDDLETYATTEKRSGTSRYVLTNRPVADRLSASSVVPV